MRCQGRMCVGIVSPPLRSAFGAQYRDIDMFFGHVDTHHY
ncbi:hypothetical protein LMG29660_04281 [Burkholderia puraquae]|uniref:Uncharacterized protein n=1 Tax=Burkholderia puraquae TaxID=1904757 RepID=A0A6J5E584_9BURK|nr:hypothetical protein LMG29660_04281 [Burkholderia puraquae]